MLFPWPGFFELVCQADVYVHLDDAQFSRGSFTNRVQIKHQSGIKWITVPLVGKGTSQRIIDLRASGTDWKDRHRAVIQQALRAAPYLGAALDLLDRVYSREPLVSLLMASIEDSVKMIGMKGPSRWLRSSEMDVTGTGSKRVLAVVQSLGGTRYVTAHGAAGYLDHEAFERAGVAVEYADYSKTYYGQAHHPFTPFVSILDVIANLGPSSKTVLHPKTLPWRVFLNDKSAPTSEEIK